MSNKKTIPSFIFESSWEVCNKVGGIYTVLSTRANTLQQMLKDRVIFIGPDFWIGKENPLFLEDSSLMEGWAHQACKEGLNVRAGRWNIPGLPLVILVDFQPFFAIKDQLYGSAWSDFGVDSLHAYGDYDEASMFSYAAGRVVESYYQYYLQGDKQVIYQAHEWMTGLGALYVRKHVPAIGTIFTTHATSIGRSICGNNKPLYQYLNAYNGNQMAQELNMDAKHSIERCTAHNVDCFTTVSDVTALECLELLDKRCDAVLMNGFESDFVPKAAKFTKARKEARQRLFKVANALTGCTFADDTLIVATSGRYEYKNKGIDVFLEAMKRSLSDENLKRPVLAFVEVPGWVAGPREDLQQRLQQDEVFDTPLDNPIITHNLHNQEHDNVSNTLHWYGMQNRQKDKVKVIFVPCYLDGRDGIVDMPYYDVLIGNDLTVYPSYYEPWGYTPLESVAFKVPTITTSLSGFGMWANKEKGGLSRIEDGVEVIERNDYNFDEVADGISNCLARFSQMKKTQVDSCRRKASELSEKALWKNFIQYYQDAYRVALDKVQNRILMEG